MVDIATAQIAFEQLSLVEAQGVLFGLAPYLIGIVIYSIFIFKFYRFLAKRDIFELDLDKYNKAPMGFLSKIMDSVLYLVKYIFLFPLVIFFWFLILSVMLIFLAKEQPIQLILLVSIAIVTSVRITSYYKEDLSRDLGKMMPFALLGVFLIDISYFNFNKSILLIMQLGSLWTTMTYYLIFVIGLEFLMRVLHKVVTTVIPKKEEEPEKEEIQE